MGSSVECPGSKEPLGGGVEVVTAYELGDIGGTLHNKEVKVLESYPLPPPSRKWSGTIKNEHTGDQLQITWATWAVCANVTT